MRPLGSTSSGSFLLWLAAGPQTPGSAPATNLFLVWPKTVKVSKRTPSNVSQHSRSWEGRRHRRSQGVSKRAVEGTQGVNMTWQQPRSSSMFEGPLFDSVP
jgi:hypothetical protein